MRSLGFYCHKRKREQREELQKVVTSEHLALTLMLTIKIMPTISSNSTRRQWEKTKFVRNWTSKRTLKICLWQMLWLFDLLWDDKVTLSISRIPFIWFFFDINKQSLFSMVWDLYRPEKSNTKVLGQRGVDLENQSRDHSACTLILVNPLVSKEATLTNPKMWSIMFKVQHVIALKIKHWSMSKWRAHVGCVRSPPWPHLAGLVVVQWNCFHLSKRKEKWRVQPVILTCLQSWGSHFSLKNVYLIFFEFINKWSLFHWEPISQIYYLCIQWNHTVYNLHSINLCRLLYFIDSGDGFHACFLFKRYILVGYSCKDLVIIRCNEFYLHLCPIFKILIIVYRTLFHFYPRFDLEIRTEGNQGKSRRKGIARFNHWRSFLSILSMEQQIDHIHNFHAHAIVNEIHKP